MVADLVWETALIYQEGNPISLTAGVSQCERHYQASDAFRSLHNIFSGVGRPDIAGNNIIFLGGTLAHGGGDLISDPARCMSYFLMRDIIRYMDPNPASVTKFFLQNPLEKSGSEAKIRKQALGINENDPTYNPDIKDQDDLLMYDALMQITPETVLVIINPGWPARQYLVFVMEDLMKQERMPKAIVCEPSNENDGDYPYDDRFPDPTSPTVRDTLGLWKQYPINTLRNPGYIRDWKNISLYIRPTPQ
ncbi:hypothetical protein BDV96DRAFT_605407 [Lophiotrema nucula]|uniref:Uncharacterized protein n=1 Tax=Lophiotrema nucula TaxID=690887 RepID=A0A6A5YPL1_9PLEO|nr:hypothetical protein BDV96DRAFT_605407 [Lophiotrema nucula]